MRLIETHKVNGLNEALAVKVLDEPGQGGACHRYKIWPVELDVFDVTTDVSRGERLLRANCDIHFQQGPIAEHGVNGVSNEALLAIVRDRLEAFQAGPYACDYNRHALLCVIDAMETLKNRTRERMARGVEGTSQK